MTSAIRYEWRRISSVRATWILVGIAIALSTALALLFSLAIGTAGEAADANQVPGLDVSLAGSVSSSTTNLIVLILLGTVAAQAFGQEYRHGTIRLTLTEFPRRTSIFAAKVIICCLVILASFLVSTVIAWAILRGNSGIVDEGFASFGAYFLRTCAYLVGFCLIVFAITVLTRILALGVVIPLVFAAVAEPLLATLVGKYISWFPNVLPFASGSEFVAGTDMLRNGAVFGVWVVVLIAAGYVVFEKRDA